MDLELGHKHVGHGYVIGKLGCLDMVPWISLLPKCSSSVLVILSEKKQ